MTPAASLISIKRRDGSTIQATLITRGPRGRESTDRRIFEPVVGPGGDIIPAEVNTTLDKPGVRFVKLIEGELVLTMHAKRLGYVFYRDMCLYGLPATEDRPAVEASREHWHLYQALSELKAKNQVPAEPIPDDVKYHPEVVRRMSEHRSGAVRVPQEKIDEVLARIRAQSDDGPEARASARAKGLHVPESEPGDVDEIVAKIKRSKK
jgi:hypothetical protein